MKRRINNNNRTKRHSNGVMFCNPGILFNLEAFVILKNTLLKKNGGVNTKHDKE